MVTNRKYSEIAALQPSVFFTILAFFLFAPIKIRELTVNRLIPDGVDCLPRTNVLVAR
jgi:hypothetical protein